MNQDRTYSEEWKNLMKANVIPFARKVGQSNKRWMLIYADSIFHTTPDTFDLNDTSLKTSTVEGFVKKVLRYKDEMPKDVETDIIAGLLLESRMGLGKDGWSEDIKFECYMPISGYDLFRKRFVELRAHAKFNPGTNLRDIAPLIAAWKSYIL